LNVGTKNSGRWGIRRNLAQGNRPRGELILDTTSRFRAPDRRARAGYRRGARCYNPTHGIAHAGHSESHESVRAPAGDRHAVAERIAFHLLKENQEEAFALSDAIRDVKTRVGTARSAII